MTGKEKYIVSLEADRFGYLDKKLAPFKSEIAEREKLSKKLRARADAEPADQPCVFEGDHFTLKLSARTMKRVFKPGALKRLFNFLGDAFYKIAEVPLGKFDDHVTILDRSKYVVEEQIGYRTIEAIEKPALQKAA